MTDHLVSPVMRFVTGSLTEKQKTDYQNKPIAEDDQRFSFGFALRKDNDDAQSFLQSIMQKAWNDYAHAPHIQALVQQFNLGKNTGFSWKIKDGDVPNNQGKINSNTAGCWVLYFSSNYSTKTCDAENKELDVNQIYRGCYVQVAFSVVGNGKTDNTAGVYLNPHVIKFIAHGEKVTGGMDAETAFANAPVPQQLPPGASLTPVATGGMPGIPPVGNTPQTGQSNSTTTSPTSALPLVGFSNGPGSPTGSSAPLQPGMPIPGQ